jgi:hypothetical protein
VYKTPGQPAPEIVEYEYNRLAVGSWRGGTKKTHTRAIGALRGLLVGGLKLRVRACDSPEQVRGWFPLLNNTMNSTAKRLYRIALSAALLTLAELPHTARAQPATAPTVEANKSEDRVFAPAEIRDIRLSGSDGSITFTVGAVTYTYQLDGVTAASAFLAEMRRAHKVAVGVTVPLPPSNAKHLEVYSCDLWFDTLK